MTTIRPGTAADLPALTELFEERDRVRYAPDAVARRLGSFDAERARTLVAVVDGRVVATSTLLFRRFGTTRRTERVGYWTDLYVAERARSASLYLPLARATQAASADAGAFATLTANRRRDVWTSHLKLGFRIASAMPTRARPVSAIGAALRFASFARVAHRAQGLDAIGFALVDRVLPRPRAAVDVRERPIDRGSVATIATLLVRDRGRSAGTAIDPDELLLRYAPPLEGRAYRALIAERDGQPIGAAIVRTARRSRVELTVVLDVLDGGDADVFHGLVRAVETFARTNGTDAVLALDGVADQSRLWDAAGYPATPEWYVLLVSPVDRAADKLFGDGTGWRFPFAEHDAF